MFDIDTLNTINAEERQYKAWYRSERNRILNIYNQDKKVAEWERVFGFHKESDDSWLSEAKVF